MSPSRSKLSGLGGPSGSTPCFRCSMSAARPKSSRRPAWLGEDQGRWDHFRIHNQLLIDPRIDAYSIAIFGGLAAHADSSSGRSSPSMDTLARYARCSRRTVIGRLETLVEHGYLGVDKRDGHSNVYRLLPCPTLPTSVVIDLSVKAKDWAYRPPLSCEPGAHPKPEGANLMHTAGELGAHPKLEGANLVHTTREAGAHELENRNLQPEEQNPPAPPGEQAALLGADSLVIEPEAPELFEAFWKAYPRRDGQKVGKDAALKVWRRLPRVDQDAALDCVQNHREVFLAAKAGRPPDAQRFLRARLWAELDYAAPTPLTTVPSIPSIPRRDMSRAQERFERNREVIMAVAEGRL